MHIDVIGIDGFGIWHDARLEPDRGLTLVRGDNEAGKTTLLAFVRAVLFGFETNRHPALLGGRRGGWLEVTMADERCYRIERHGERGGEGTLRVLGEDGVDRGPAFLARLLHGVESSVYRNVFAFRLDELSEFRGLTEGGVASRIYGAGLGTGATSALAVEAGLRNEASGLFKSGGTNPPINRLLAEVEALDQRLSQLDTPADYAAHRARLAEREARRTHLTAELERLTAERRRLERIATGWQPWLQLRAAEAALAEMPAPSALPSGVLERLSGIEAATRASQERLADIRRRRQRIEERLSAERPDASLIDRRAEIRQLERARAEDRARAASLEAARRDLQIAERTVSEGLAELGTDWDTERLAAVDLSVAARSAVAGRFRDLLDGTARDLDHAGLEKSNADRAVADAARELDHVEERLAETDGEGAQHDDQRESAFAALSAALVARRALGGESPAAEPRDQGATLAAAIAVLGLVGAAGLVLADAPAAAVALGVVAGMIAVLAWLLARRTPRGLTELASRLDEEIARQTRAAGLVEVPDPAELEQLRAVFAERRSLVGRRAVLAEHRQLAVQRREHAEEARRVAAERLEQASRSHAAALDAWSSWLGEHGYAPGIDRETAATFLDAAAGVRAAVRRRDEARSAIDRLEDERREFRVAVSRLLGELGRPPVSDEELAAAVDRLVTDLATAGEASEARARLEEERTELLAEEQDAVRRLEGDSRRRDELLASCGVENEEGLRALAESVAEHRARVDEARTARQALTALSGPGDALQRLIDEIGAVTDIAAVHDRLAAIRDELSAVTAERDAVIGESGALTHQIEALERSSEASALRQRRADLVARLEDQAGRWSVLRLAAALLERTRQRYEREHRPGVIRTAEAYLAEWTDGRYRQILAPLGGTIEGLERADGRSVPVAGLSRGTAEQLYLALRFGLIEHFADEAEPLPIVMDEILVNFDEARAARTARTIEQLANRHQILYFTCRPATPLSAGRTIRLEPPTLGAAVGADRPPAVERA